MTWHIAPVPGFCHTRSQQGGGRVALAAREPDHERRLPPDRDVRARMLAELRAARAGGASGEEQLAILRKWAPFLDDERAQPDIACASLPVLVPDPDRLLSGRCH